MLQIFYSLCSRGENCNKTQEPLLQHLIASQTSMSRDSPAGAFPLHVICHDDLFVYDLRRAICNECSLKLNFEGRTAHCATQKARAIELVSLARESTDCYFQSE